VTDAAHKNFMSKDTVTRIRAYRGMSVAVALFVAAIVVMIRHAMTDTSAIDGNFGLALILAFAGIITILATLATAERSTQKA
jgi:hypothetical protein